MIVAVLTEQATDLVTQVLQRCRSHVQEEMGSLDIAGYVDRRCADAHVELILARKVQLQHAPDRDWLGGRLHLNTCKRHDHFIPVHGDFHIAIPEPSTAETRGRDVESTLAFIE